MNDILKLQTKPSLSPRKPANQLGEGGGGSSSSSSSNISFKSFFSVFCK
jgi:hypothetical protein